MSLSVDILSKIISIPSQIGIENEKDVAEYLEKLLREHHFKIDIHEYAKGRPNIIATYEFEKDGPTILFNGHMDTMPAQNGEKISVWNTDPFCPEIIDGKMYGRGACDMKGGIAGALAAIFRIIDENMGRGKIIVNLVCDE